MAQKQKEQQYPNMFRQAFDLWERTTSAYFQSLVRNPLFLTANSACLNSMLMAKKVADSSMRTMISSFGLPTRHDQERALHMLHKIEARLDDMEFRMEQAPAHAAPQA